MPKTADMLLIGFGGKPKGDKPKGKMPMIGEEPEANEASDDAKKGKLSAAKALITALEDGDADAVNEALSAHYKLCALDTSAEDEDAY